MTERNPYETNSPAWQLFENMTSNELSARAFAADSERYLAKAADCRQKAALYRQGLQDMEAGRAQRQANEGEAA